MVVRSARLQWPQFFFTSAQLNIGMCSGLHTDSANVGPSLVLGLGPHAGGELWSYQPGEGVVHELMNWTPINGRIAHRNHPFAGHMSSIVLFTHNAVYANSTAPVLQTLAECGFPIPPMPLKYIPPTYELTLANAV